jgi:ABC-type iron transport system FetAB permease component
VLVTTFFVTLFIGILGARYAINDSPFWLPELFIPTIGLLLGITAGGMAVGLTTCLTKVGEQAEQIETYLSFGATRWEAGRIVAREAIRLALLPTINQMSVIGLITIPGILKIVVLAGETIC